MSLTDTINNTNTQKENVKQVATQIDNKLIELGGERATDLNDVANKIGAMVTENYKKIAEIDSYKVSFKEGETKTLTYSLPLKFNPTRLIIGLGNFDGGDKWYKIVLDTKYRKQASMSNYASVELIGEVGKRVTLKIKSESTKNIDIMFLAIE